MLEIILTVASFFLLIYIVSCVRGLFDKTMKHEGIDFLYTGTLLGGTVLLVVAGFPVMIHRLPSMISILILTIGLAVFFFTVNVSFTGNLIVDNLIIGLLFLLLTLSFSMGVLWIFSYGLTMSILAWWLLLSGVISFGLRLGYWVKYE